MILAIIESKSAGMVSPSLTPVSTRMPGAARQRQQLDPTRRRREVAIGVLGVESRFDGVPGLSRLGTFQAAAGRYVQLEAHQIGTRGDLGDRVLHL
jgi:hypothetical protein